MALKRLPLRIELLRHSLAGRLYGSLLVSVLVLVIVQGGMAFRSALMSADRLFDYHMQQMALSLRTSRPIVEVGPPPMQRSETPVDHDFVVQIWSEEGVQIFHSAGRANLPSHQVLGFSTSEANGHAYRVYSVQAGERVIQVAQDLSARRAQALKLALDTIAPVGLMVPVFLMVVGWVVRRSLRPVQAVRAQVAARQANDLDPVDATGVPVEIRPLVQEMNALLARMRDAFEAQRHFVADAAHELRSPLTALRLQVQLMQRAADPQSRKSAEERLLDGIDRATRLISQLLELARSEAGAESDGKKVQPVSLPELACEVIGREASRAQMTDIDLGYVGDATSGEPIVTGQRGELTILLRNLVDNAIKYTPAGGRVDVDCIGPEQGKWAGGWRIEDSGPGIAEADRARVFERFHRGVHLSSDQQQPASVDGSGLGLAIVRAIAERHGARVELGHSDSLGGLRVDVHFPVGAARPGNTARTGPGDPVGVDRTSRTDRALSADRPVSPLPDHTDSRASHR